MNRTTTRLFAFAVASAATLSSAVACVDCNLALSAATTHECHECLHDQFQVGGGNEPAAYISQDNGWSNTSSGLSSFGEEAVLTWSIVPDGTSLPRGAGEPASPSNLIAFLDDIHHGGPGPGGADLTRRSWFPLVKSAFDRWAELSAIRFAYEPNDDGAPLGGAAGILGRRGDHRIGGHPIDGTTSPTTVAYNFFPNNSDMVIDTDEVGRLGNPADNYLRLRNTLTHEIGHGLGLNHVGSSSQNFLMEAILDVTIDGPQFDDVLGIHRLYGDRFEEFGGNDAPGNATDLGTISMGHSIIVGADAVDAIIRPDEFDFVSINKLADIDYYRISAGAPGRLSIAVEPLGPTYEQGPHNGTLLPFNASAQNNLSLFLYDVSGTNLHASSITGEIGIAETIEQFPVEAATEYLIRVSGMSDAAQFYRLNVTLVPEPDPLTIMVLGAQWLVWRRRHAT